MTLKKKKKKSLSLGFLAEKISEKLSHSVVSNSLRPHRL